MRVEITAAEWRVVLGRAREVGAAMGAERAAVLAARAAVEALGVRVPVTDDEVAAVATPRTRATPDPAIPDPERPVRDLRAAARGAAAAGTDGFCAHCDTVYGAAALAVLADGTRLCPVHGTAVRDVAEAAEGAFTVAHAPSGPRALSLSSARGGGGEAAGRGGAEVAGRCGAPVGGRRCTEDAGHPGRHKVARAGTGEAGR